MAIPNGGFVTLEDLNNLRKLQPPRKEGYDFYLPPEEGDTPTPPLYAPNPNSPVYDLKRETAIRKDYTPETIQDLYQTPVELRFDDGGGWYSGPNKPIRVGTQILDRVDVLGHEYGHKRFFEDLPDQQQFDWRFAGGMDREMPQAVVALNAERPDSQMVKERGPDARPIEGYAMIATRRGAGLTPEQRERWYPRMFEGTPPELPPNPISGPNQPRPYTTDRVGPDVLASGLDERREAEWQAAFTDWANEYAAVHAARRAAEPRLYEDASWSGESPPGWLVRDEWGPRTFSQYESFPETLPGRSRPLREGTWIYGMHPNG